MYSVMVAFGLASLMLCIGMACRGRIKFFQNMLMPVSVIAGIIGFLFVNLGMTHLPAEIVSTTDFSNIVDVFFVLSFISIGLTGSKKEKKEKGEKKKGRKRGGAFSGGFGMAMIWCILFSLTAVAGSFVLYIIGPAFHMDPMYGFMIPFAFCQGPGQASTYGRLFEQTYGYQNAEMVALTFAVCGFLAAFLVGVPLARYGLKKGLGKKKGNINDTVLRGYNRPSEQHEAIGKLTFQSSNIETIAAHFAIIGICYLLALGFAKVIAFIPGLGETFAAMLFMWGQLAAVIVRKIMEKLNISFLINNQFMSKITGFLTDYLIVCAFMAISVGMIGTWIIPILIMAVVATLISTFVCIFCGSRLGSDHDFERTLGTYGACTGTIPSGVSLLRIIDPRLQTPTGAELGIMNALLIVNTIGMIFITLCGLHTISIPVCMAILLATVIVYAVLMKLFGGLNKPTFSLRKGRLMENETDSDTAILQGTLRNPDDVLADIVSSGTF